ncbi:hypothetical protein Q8F55_007380 [Vanrija albida]|uniref:Tryptophan synthase beta chain-like PALP domain-containing protein n=1 Tax=Vanrija albida TaxID=181172 RepID=A0ABR3PTK3_9TREE
MSSSSSSNVQRVHAALFPTHGPTRLHALPTLAKELGVRAVYVKDESARYGLPAFKILGASYALASTLASRWGVEAWDVAALRGAAAREPGLTIYAATDGNHGRATAHTARLLGLPARVYVPRTVEPWSIAAIESEGCTVTQVDDDYDGAVRAAADAAAAAGGLLIQDMSWEGYEAIPELITQGYMTITSEVDAQLPPGTQATAVVVPVGVGSLAHAVVQWYHGGAGRAAQSKASPRILTAEPEAAPCLSASLASGRESPTPVETSFTIMPGLNCGTVNPQAWPDLRRVISPRDALVVSDDDAAREVAALAALGVPAGPCGAASLAAARKAALGPDDVVVLICTEGTAGAS